MRKQYSAQFKAQLVLQVLREEKSVSELASEHSIHYTQIQRWRRQVLEQMPEIFAKDTKARSTQLALVEWDRPDLPISQQAALLDLNRSGLYEQPRRPAPGLSVSAAGAIHPGAEPGMGDRLDLHTPLARLDVPGGRHGLVFPYVISWALDQTMEVSFTLEAVQQALDQARPDIMNSDQGSQFTSSPYIDLLKSLDVRISMDGKGRATDNIFIERLWRNVKYEEVYLHEYRTPREARNGINEYLPFYNHDRPHQSLQDQTPAEVYFGISREGLRSLEPAQKLS